MEAKLISLKCPNCHADVHIKDGSKIVYCEHCGAGLMLDDGVERKEETRNINITNKTYVNTVDEAKLRRAIDDGDLARRKFEEEAFEREQERKRKESQRAFAKKFFPIGFIVHSFICGSGDV